MTPDRVAEALAALEKAEKKAEPGRWWRAEFIAKLRNAAPALLKVAEASQRFRMWGEKITAYIESKDEPDPDKNNWVTYLHQAQDDTNAALDALAEAVLG